MKSTTKFYIELKSTEWYIVKDTACLAALANGGSKAITIEELATFAKLRSAELAGDPFTISLIDKTLLIDRGTENQLIIEEREYFEIDKAEISSEDARDILNELNPILCRGINNPDNPEAIN